ncbi:PaaD-like zinc ribbon domain-containing protein [Calditerricola satsumensis]|uniref:PaaD-like zinc ribbon domain-containing protein n=1 Tax=Calditerricola satsumensis TaxID=373054 RepID=UPI0009F8EA7A
MKAAPCPFCGSHETTCVSRFGSAQLLSQYYCQNCSSFFEYVRWEGEGERQHREEGEDACPNA